MPEADPFAEHGRTVLLSRCEDSDLTAPVCTRCGAAIEPTANTVGPLLCAQCAAIEISAPTESSADISLSDAVGRFLLYGLSLPERTVRSGVGLAAGTAQELAQFVVPKAFQSSKTYEIAVKNSLDFLTGIGGVKPAETAEPQAEGYVARKAVGNFVDLAGLVTLHMSPMWLMAIVSDVAYGSQSYVRELAAELKSQGLIDETSTIHNVDDVLNAVRDTAGKTASMIDTPPLSVDELKKSLDQTRASLASADYLDVLPEAEIAKYWTEMREIAARDHVSLLGVSGALTMHAFGKAGTVTQGTLAGAKVAGGLVNRVIISHYAESLRTIREQGFFETVRSAYAPYIDAVWTNFHSDKSTWTEEVVSGRALSKAYQMVSGWFSGKPTKPGAADGASDVVDTSGGCPP